MPDGVPDGEWLPVGDSVGAEPEGDTLPVVDGDTLGVSTKDGDSDGVASAVCDHVDETWQGSHVTVKRARGERASGEQRLCHGPHWVWRDATAHSSANDNPRTLCSQEQTHARHTAAHRRTAADSHT